MVIYCSKQRIKNDKIKIKFSCQIYNNEFVGILNYNDLMHTEFIIDKFELDFMEINEPNDLTNNTNYRHQCKNSTLIYCILSNYYKAILNKTRNNSKSINERTS